MHLTAAGRRLIERAFAQHRTEMEEALAEFSMEDRRALLPLLRRLGRTAEAAPDIAEVSSVMVKEAPAPKLSAGRSSK